jgi:DNA repair protein RadC
MPAKTAQLASQSRNAKAVDIELIDHVILGRKECDPAHLGYYSFRSAGLL